MLLAKESVKAKIRFNEILENVCGGIILCQYDGNEKNSKIIYINSGWTTITGYTLEQLEAEKDGNPQAVVFREDKVRCDQEYLEQMREGNMYELTYRIVHRSGKICWVIDKGIVEKTPDGNLINQSIITEVTRIKEHEEQLRILAQIDQLTNLNNKITFANQAQIKINNQQKKLYALFLLDIDGFKYINDSYGHVLGDKVLESVAKELQNSFSEEDILGRDGGDEFVVLMSAISKMVDATEKAEELCQQIRKIEILGHKYPPITVSIGISFYRYGETYKTLYKEADAALYRAKDQGKNTYSL